MVSQVGQAQGDLATAARRAAADPSPRRIANVNRRKAEYESRRALLDDHLIHCTAIAAPGA